MFLHKGRVRLHKGTKHAMIFAESKTVNPRQESQPEPKQKTLLFPTIRFRLTAFTAVAALVELSVPAVAAELAHRGLQRRNFEDTLLLAKPE